MKRMILVLALLVLALAIPAHAGDLPVRIEGFKLDGIEMVDNAFNRLDLQRDKEYQAEMRFTPLQDVRNMQVEVFASGFEYSDVSPIESTSRIFDADANVTYVRRFNLRLSDQVDEDDYKIRVLFSDRNNNELVRSYNVKFDVSRHLLKVVDMVFYPAGSVQAGESLLTTVRLENQGEKVENDVRVEVSVPALGIAGTDYIDEIKNGGNREKGTEEIFMRIPDCAKPGSYDVIVKVLYNQLHDVTQAKSKIEVAQNPVCQKDKIRTVPDTVVVYKSPQQVNSEAAKSQAADTKDKTATQKEAATDKTSKESSVSTPSTFEKMRNTLEVILLVLIAILILIAGVLAFRGLNKEDESP